MNLLNTRMALQKLGYVSQGIEYMVSEITKVLAKYESPEEATRVLENALPRVVHSRFGEKQLTPLSCEVLTQTLIRSMIGNGRK